LVEDCGGTGDSSVFEGLISDAIAARERRVRRTRHARRFHPPDQNGCPSLAIAAFAICLSLAFVVMSIKDTMAMPISI
jgi:hypothetical protein